MRHIVGILAVALCCSAISCDQQASSTNDEISRLIRHIDDDPNPLHADYTPAVERLIEIGPPALPAVLPLVLSDDFWTRTHAVAAAAGVLEAHYGFVRGHGWPSDAAEHAFREQWSDLGGLDADAPIKVRRRQIEKWQIWARDAIQKRAQTRPTMPRVG